MTHGDSQQKVKKRFEAVKTFEAKSWYFPAKQMKKTKTKDQLEWETQRQAGDGKLKWMATQSLCGAEYLLAGLYYAKRGETNSHGVAPVWSDCTQSMSPTVDKQNIHGNEMFEQIDTKGLGATVECLPQCGE